MNTTDQGVLITSEEDYYNWYMKKLKKYYPNMSDSPSNLLVIYARIQSRIENKRDYNLALSYSKAYPSTATGDSLSKSVRIQGITRLEGTHAVGYVNLTKEDNIAQVIIPSKTQIKSDNLIYITNNNTTLIISEDITRIEIQSIDVGTLYNISEGSKFTTVENISGIKTIIADTDISGGTNLETDTELRKRYDARSVGYRNSSLNGIITSVMDIEDTTTVGGDENITNKEVDGLLPNSFIIYVNGGTEQEIADVIMQAKPAGIPTNGDISVSVNVYGKDHIIRFSRFTYAEVYYDIQVAVDKSTVLPNFEDQLRKLIVDYTSTNEIIVGYELSAYISKNMFAVIGVSRLNFGLEENPTTDVTLIAESGSSFLTDDEKIAVEVI